MQRDESVMKGASPPKLPPHGNSARDGSGAAPARRGAYTTSFPNDPEAAGRELLDKLAAYVAQLGGTLGDGWSCHVKMVTVAASGGSGTCNASYSTPSGRRLRSRGEVAKFLGLDASGTGTGVVSHAGEPRRSGGGGSTAGGAGGGSAGAASTGGGSGGGAGSAVAGAADAGDGSLPPRSEVYAVACARAARLTAEGRGLPLRLRSGVVVESLGQVDARPAFNTPLGLHTPGFRAVFDDAGVGRFVSEIRAPAGAKHPLFVVSFEPAVAAAPAAALAHSGGGGGGGAADDDAAPGAATASSGTETVYELACARNADVVWTQVVGLQERARLQADSAAAAASSRDNGAAGVAGAAAAVPAAAHPPLGGTSSAAGATGTGSSRHVVGVPHGDTPLPAELAALLARAHGIKGCWGRAMFGLADADVLQHLEALAGADKAPGYVFVDERGGWDKERELLAKGRWAKRGALPPAAAARSAGTDATKRSGGSGGGSGGAQGSGGGNGGGTPAAAGGQPAARKRPAPAAAGSQGGAGGPRRQRITAAGNKDTQAAAAVARVVDRMMSRLEVWWAAEPAREAKRASKAATSAAGRGARTAAAAHGAGKAVEAATQSAAASGCAAANEAAAAAAAAPPPLQDDLSLPGADTPPPPAVPVLATLRGDAAQQLLQLWDFACTFAPLLDLPHVPSPAQLEAGLLSAVSHSGESAAGLLARMGDAAVDSAAAADGAAIDSSAPTRQDAGTAMAVATVDASAAAAAAAACNTAELPGGLAGVAAAAAAAAASDQRWHDRVAADAAAATAWAELHAAIVAALVRDAHEAVMHALFDAASLRAQALRELRATAPPVGLSCWPEAARRYLAAAATCGFLALGEPRSAAAGGSARELELPGQLANMEAQDWAAYLCAGINAPSLLSRVALLPQGSSETAAEALTALDDATALAAAEQTVHKLAQQQQQQLAGKQETGAGEPQEMRARAALQALVDCRAAGAGGGSGRAMCFFAQDLCAKMGRARGVDLRGVAARLASGLYEATDSPQEALAADVGLAADLWRDAFATCNLTRAEGFRYVDSRLADALEERLREVLAAGSGDDGAGSTQTQHLAGLNAETAAAAVGAAAGTTADAGAEQSGTQQPAAPAAAGGVPKLEQQQCGVEPAEGVTEQQQQQQQCGEDGEPLPASVTDPHGLLNPARPFNPLKGCRVCWRDGDSARLLLCDGCEDEYHCYCVTPPLLEVPEGDWYCSACSAAAGDAGLPAAAGSGGVCSSRGVPDTQVEPLVWDFAHASVLPPLGDCVDGSTPAGNGAGLQELRALSGAAARLGTVHYSAWPAAARLKLALLLTDLLAGSAAGRRLLEERAEAKREAKRRMADARARINRARKEAADAAKAAAKKARVMARDATTASGGDGGAGTTAAGAANSSRQAAPPAIPLPSRGKATRAQAAATSFDEGAELAAIADAQRAAELAAVRRLCLGRDRAGRRYWLLGSAAALLPPAGSHAGVSGTGAAAAAAAAAAAGGGSGIAGAAGKTSTGKGGGGKGSKGAAASAEAKGGSLGVILVEPADAAAAALLRLQQAAPRATTSNAAGPPSGTQPAAADNKLQQQQSGSPVASSTRGEQPAAEELTEGSLAALGSLLQPAAEVAVGTGAAAAAAGAGHTHGTADSSEGWRSYASLADVDALLAWLNPAGVREAPLRAAVQRVRDAMLLFAPTPAGVLVAPAGGPTTGTAGDGDGSGAGGSSSRAVSPTAAAADAAASAAGAEPAATPPPAEHTRKDDALLQLKSPAAAAAARRALMAAAVAADGAATATELRAVLARLLDGAPADSLHEFWGSERRLTAWRAALHAATAPQHFVALAVQLEQALLPDSWRPGWALWAAPAPHPDAITSWTAAAHRVRGLEAARRPALPTRLQRDRAQERAWRAAASAAAAGGAAPPPRPRSASAAAAEPLQPRKRPRYKEMSDEDEEEGGGDDGAGEDGRRGGGRARARSSASTRAERAAQRDALAAAAGWGNCSGRAAAARASAAIHAQAAGGGSLQPAHGRRRAAQASDSEEDDSASDGDASGQRRGDSGTATAAAAAAAAAVAEQEQRDAELAAALAAAEGGYPRRRAAVAATAALARGSHDSEHPSPSAARRSATKKPAAAAGGAAAKRKHPQSNSGAAAKKRQLPLSSKHKDDERGCGSQQGGASSPAPVHSAGDAVPHLAAPFEASSGVGVTISSSAAAGGGVSGGAEPLAELQRSSSVLSPKKMLLERHELETAAALAATVTAAMHREQQQPEEPVSEAAAVAAATLIEAQDRAAAPLP